MRPLVGRATYLGPYNVPRTSRPADWRLMPAVAYLLLASHPVEQELGRTDLPSAGWPSAGGPSLLERRPRRRGRPDSCCSCSTAPVGLRESVGRRLPRRAHQPYSHGQDHPCKNLPACQQQPCAPPGRASSRAGWEGAACTVRGLHQPSGAAAQQTADCRACRLADRPQTPGRLAASAVQGCSRCQLTPTSQWTACSVSHHLMRTLFISDCISASWASFANPGCNLAATVDSEPCGAVD